jgi:hypothetical protein
MPDPPPPPQRPTPDEARAFARAIRARFPRSATTWRTMLRSTGIGVICLSIYCIAVLLLNMVLGVFGPLGFTQLDRVYLCFILWAAFVAALSLADVLPLSPTAQQGYLTYLGIVFAAPACIALGTAVLNALPYRQHHPVDFLLFGTLLLPVILALGAFAHDRGMGLLGVTYSLLVWTAIVAGCLHVWPAP